MALLFSNYCISFVMKINGVSVIQRGRVCGLNRLKVPRCRRSVNVVILNGGVVVETYLNGGNSTAGSCPDGECC